MLCVCERAVCERRVRERVRESASWVCEKALCVWEALLCVRVRVTIFCVTESRATKFCVTALCVTATGSERRSRR